MLKDLRGSRISRRALILTAGALGGGAMASSGFAQSAASKAAPAGGPRVPARSPLEWLRLAWERRPGYTSPIVRWQRLRR